MGPHMKMTSLRPIKPGDQERAATILRELGPAIEKYKDYKVALANGYRIFEPDVKAKSPQIHFNSTFGGGFTQGERVLDPTKPSSLMYEADPKLIYRLVGAMFVAPQNATEKELDKRIPLSIAQWHLHVNACFPPPGEDRDIMNPNSRFGLYGKITTAQECKAAGGRFLPVIFGWMVHAYPWEKDSKSAWDPERQMPMPKRTSANCADAEKRMATSGLAL
jgi:hypothetical protein